MQGNHAMQQRADNIRKIKAVLSKIQEGEYTHVKAQFSLQLNVSSRKIEEYLETLEEARFVEINKDNNLIKWIGGVQT